MARKKRQVQKQEGDYGPPRVLFDSVDEIPTFASDEEEVEFWNTHEPSPEFFEGAPRMTIEEALKVKDLPQR